MQNYEKIKQLGDGAYGTAVLCRDVQNQRLVVVKEVKLSGLSHSARQEAMKESDILKALRHSNIIQYLASGMAPNRVLWIAMDYAPKGDLFEFLQARQHGHYLPVAEAVGMFAQLCMAMRYLHGRNILHRDLKSKNIFLGNAIERNGNHVHAVKLGDFGIAKVLSCTVALARTQIGTPYYMSPEICRDEPYGTKSDVWAMGCLLYEMLALEVPYNGRDLARLAMAILRSPVPQLPAPFRTNGMLVAIVSALLDKTPDNRPSVQQTCGVPLVANELAFWETAHAQSEVSWSAPVTVATEVAAGEQPQWSPRGSPSSAKPKRRRRLPAVPGGRGAAAAPAATAVDSQGARDRRRISPRKGLAFMPPAQVPTAAAAAAVVRQYHEAYSSVDAPSPQRKPREGSQLSGHQVDMTSPPRKQWQAPAAQQWQPTYVEPSDRAAGGYESPRQPPNERHQHQQLSLQQQHPQHHRPQRERSVRGSTNEGSYVAQSSRSYMQARAEAQRNRAAYEHEITGKPSLHIAVPGHAVSAHNGGDADRYTTPTPTEGGGAEHLTPTERMLARKAHRQEQERLQRLGELETHRRQLLAERMQRDLGGGRPTVDPGHPASVNQQPQRENQRAGPSNPMPGIKTGGGGGGNHHRVPLAAENGAVANDDTLTPAERMRQRKAQRQAQELRRQADMLEEARRQTFDDRMDLQRKHSVTPIVPVTEADFGATTVIRYG